MVEAVKPGGLVLDLQVIRPNPVVEVKGRHICEIFARALSSMRRSTTTTHSSTTHRA
jgi:hypothetical protein